MSKDWVEKYHQHKRAEEASKGGPGSGHWGHAGRPGKRGGSLPGKGATNTPEKQKPDRYEGKAVAKAKEIERNLWNHTTEKVYIISPGGDVIVSAVGNEDSVSLTRDEWMLAKNTRGAVLTHNHPYGTSGFSINDLGTAALFDLEEIRVVHKRYKKVYAMRATNVRFGKYKDRNWPPATDVKEAYLRHWEEVGETNALRIAAKELTVSAAEAAFGAEVCRRTADEFGLEFVEEDL